MNAKKEFLRHIAGKKLICARIGTETHKFSGEVKWTILHDNYSNKEFEYFLDKIDFDYDEGFGGQELFGIILFKDSFSDRGEYDGSEWWENHKTPTIKDIIQINQ